jgi:uncharacterized protein
LIYLDTSALLKLVKAEPESPALAVYLRGEAGLVSSALLAVEARRAAIRSAPQTLLRLDLLLSRIDLVAISPSVVESASRLPDPLLRSLHAIHLATALLIREEIAVLLTYDERLATSAKNHRVPTAAPG